MAQVWAQALTGWHGNASGLGYSPPSPWYAPPPLISLSLRTLSPSLERLTTTSVSPLNELRVCVRVRVCVCSPDAVCSALCLFHL